MNELTRLYADIRAILEQARTNARSALNSAMVVANWLIAQRILHEEQQGRRCAARCVANLAGATTG